MMMTFGTYTEESVLDEEMLAVAINSLWKLCNEPDRKKWHTIVELYYDSIYEIKPELDYDNLSEFISDARYIQY